MKEAIYSLLLTFCCLSAASQATEEENRYIDSLQSVVQGSNHDTVKVNALFAWDDLIYWYDPDLDLELNIRIDSLISEATKVDVSEAEQDFYDFNRMRALNNMGICYNGIGDYENALKYNLMALELGEKCKDDRMISGSLTNIGNVYYSKGDYDEAIQYFKKGLTIQEKSGDRDFQATTINNLGLIYSIQGNNIIAIEYYTKSLKIMEEIDDKTGVSTALLNIGNLYNTQEDYAKALKYLKESLEIDRLLKDRESEALTLLNIGSTYTKMDNFEEAKNHLEMGLALAKDIGHQEAVSTALNNLGLIFIQEEKFDNAKANFEEAELISSAIGNEKVRALSLGNLGYYYKKIGNNVKAKFYAEKSMRLAEKIGSIEEIQSASKILYEANKGVGNYRDALAMYEFYIELSDSLKNEDNTRALLNQEYKYNYEKEAALDSLGHLKEKEVLDANIAKQDAEIKSKQQQQYILFGGFGLALVFAGFIFNRFRVTKKQNGIIEKQKVEVEVQRDFANKQKDIVEEKNKSIMDSIVYAKRLQEAILPTPRIVKEWLTDSFLFYKPKDIVAGDFYWMETIVTEINDKKTNLIFFAAADCTGHGVPGAMVSVVCADALNRAVKEFHLKEPGKVLDKVKELVIDAFNKSDEKISDGMDIALCALDISGKMLYYAGANNPLWIVSEKLTDSDNKYTNDSGTHELIEYKATKQPIGSSISNNPFFTEEVRLKPGDAIYIFSDGFVDQFGGEKGKKYKSANFKRYLLSIHEDSMEVQRQKLETEFEHWKGDLEQIDDVCVIGVKINGKERNNFTASELEVLSFLKEGLPSKLIADKLGLTKNTIDTYRRRLLAKTNTYNATELINYCQEKEII
jgi:tetratricopeptide (TPR) repeat protein/DNA-binding CsgD family transcriptional regulator